MNSSFVLAKQLLKMGYEVLYLAMGKESMHIRENGFKYVLLNPRQKKRNIKSLGAHVRHFYLYQQVVNRKIEKRILEERPCVCLTENLLLSVNFLKYGVPLIFFENILVHRFSAKVPPAFSGLHYTTKWYSWLLNTGAWLLSHKNFVARSYRFFLYGFYLRNYKDKKYKKLDIYRQIRKLGGRYYMAEHRHRLIGFDYYAFPPELDFPGKKHLSDYVYGGTHVYLDRVDGRSFELKATSQQRVIYCALGTLSFYTNADDRFHFYHQLLAAFRQRADLHLVLSMPREDMHPDLQPYPPNVQVQDFVPQIKVLGIADLFITHGGPSSIKEAVYFGVPMIVFPLRCDQPGNAARVIYHRLGVSNSFKSVTDKEFLRQIDYVLGNEEIKKSVLHFQRIFRAQNDCSAGVAFVEKVIRENPVVFPSPMDVVTRGN
ncbi:nucleotide disphospho-sugar-binding domain-containing protein [Chitinophaga sp. 212800010-3]|uniref:glycosyltransferase n=1 Tax=unclassified Chitinophaga TaxID=2619133 RepID=UPI002E0D57DE